MTWKPHVTVAAVAEREGRVLLVEETVGGRTVLNQPAGHLEPGEDLVEAVVREAREETGRDFVPEAVTGVYLWDGSRDGRTFLRVCFSGRCGEPVPGRALDTGILGADWFRPDALRAAPDRLRSPMVLRCIDDYLAGRRYPLDILQQIS